METEVEDRGQGTDHLDIYLHGRDLDGYMEGAHVGIMEYTLIPVAFLLQVPREIFKF